MRSAVRSSGTAATISSALMELTSGLLSQNTSAWQHWHFHNLLSPLCVCWKILFCFDGKRHIFSFSDTAFKSEV